MTTFPSNPTGASIRKSDHAHSVIRTRCKQLMIELDCSTYRELAIKLNIDYGYLYHLTKGTKTEPGPKILTKLGLKRVITYERA